MRNIEIKARLTSLADARRVAESLATSRVGVERQLDTYFRVPDGRLKLREITAETRCTAQLVAYARPDSRGPKGSDYTLVEIPDPIALKRALGATLGVWIVVDKRREIFLRDNVRIHLDEVVGLGTFLEFEAVLDDDMDDATGERQLTRLMEQFHIAPESLLGGSYSDLLAASA